MRRREDGDARHACRARHVGDRAVRVRDGAGAAVAQRQDQAQGLKTCENLYDPRFGAGILRNFRKITKIYLRIFH